MKDDPVGGRLAGLGRKSEPMVELKRFDPTEGVGRSFLSSFAELKPDSVLIEASVDVDEAW